MNGKAFDIPDGIVPENHLGDTIINTVPIMEALEKETKRTIKGVMTSIEGNFNVNSKDIRFKRVRKCTLDNINDLRRNVIDDIVIPILNKANLAIEELEMKIFELDKELRDLKNA